MTSGLDVQFSRTSLTLCTNDALECLNAICVQKTFHSNHKSKLARGKWMFLLWSYWVMNDKTNCKLCTYLVVRKSIMKHVDNKEFRN